MKNYTLITDINQRRREFLEDTVAFYNLGNRAVDPRGGMCIYTATATSPGCAIGRHVDPKIAASFGTDACTVPQVFTKLPEWMQEMGEIFLRRVQLIHDHTRNWTTEGLSEAGVQYVTEIKEHYNL